MQCPKCKTDNLGESAFCAKCGGQMRIISFIEDHKVIDKIIDHLILTFKAERPPPPKAQLNMAAEERVEYI